MPSALNPEAADFLFPGKERAERDFPPSSWKLGNTPTRSNPYLDGRLSSSVCILEEGELHPLRTSGTSLGVSTLMNLELR